MKESNTLNLFWAIVWGVMLICSILGLFWKPFIYGIILPSAFLFGMFVYDYITVRKLR